MGPAFQPVKRQAGKPVPHARGSDRRLTIDDWGLTIGDSPPSLRPFVPSSLSSSASSLRAFPIDAYLALGANLGCRRDQLAAALKALDAHPHITITAVSSLCETEPVGGPPHQPKYLNAAAAVKTTLSPQALLQATQAIEQRLGRTRSRRNGGEEERDEGTKGRRDGGQSAIPNPQSAIRNPQSAIPNAARTIDIDILLYGDLVHSSPTLTIPHPRMHQRRFVLQPLTDIAPTLIHPAHHRSIVDLLGSLPAGYTVKPVAGPAWPPKALQVERPTP